MAGMSLPPPEGASGERAGDRRARDGRADADTLAPGFWPKVRRTLGRVPFLDEAIAAYFCAADPDTPSHVRAMLLAALAYFVVPADLIPDFVAGLGFSDDASVLFASLTVVRRHVTAAHRDRATQVVRALRAGGGSPSAK
jgi:uncharacterized membrane protein YkvA (DUF1232 family)